MYKNAKVIRLIPDQTGHGGYKSAISSFTQNLDVREAHNAWVYRGRWQRTPGLVGYGPGPLQVIQQSYSIHNYLKYSLTNAALGPTSKILTHDMAVDGTNYINSLTSPASPARGVVVRSSFASPNAATPAVFLNIKNRCFVAWSTTNGFIYDGLDTLYNTLDYGYDIGIEGPVTAPTYTLSGYLNYTNAALYYITATTGSNKVNGLPIFPTIAPIWTSGVVAVSILGVRYEIQSPNGYASTFTIAGTATGTSGTDQLTINGFLFPANGDWNGLLLTVGGNGYKIKSYVFAGANTTVTLVSNLLTSPSGAVYTVTGEQLVLTKAYLGGTNIGGLFMYAYSGALAWSGSGPRYAYAYYDPVTGHVSNPSPFLQIAEQDQLGVNIALDAIMPSVTTDQTRFTKIIIFRTTVEGGALLYPIGVFGYPPTFDVTVTNSGGLAKQYTDNHPDSDLLRDANLIAPQNNGKPPAATHMLYYDQRVWINPVTDPSAIIFSSSSFESPFGVAEECFNPINQLRVPTDDGRVRGMRLVGNQAQIMTDRYSHVIVGGPDSSSYRLVRLGPQTFGVSDYQMVELPGDTGDNSSALAYLSRDTREFILAPSLGNVCVTDPVSDIFTSQITTATNYYDSRIHYFAATGMRLLLTGLPGATMVYNFDQKTWCLADATYGADPARQVQGFCTIFGGDTRPTDLLVVNNGSVYAWMRQDLNEGPSVAYIKTPPLDLAEGHKVRKRVNFVRIYSNAPTLSVTLTVNESQTEIGMVAVPQVDPIYDLYKSPSDPVDGTGYQELIAHVLKPLSEGTTNFTDGYRHEIQVTWPVADQARYEIAAIDVCYTILDDGNQDVSP